jgi:hypothetical protein
MAMYVTATAFDVREQESSEVRFEVFVEITRDDVVREALQRLLRVVPARHFTRIEIALK